MLLWTQEKSVAVLENLREHWPQPEVSGDRRVPSSSHSLRPGPHGQKMLLLVVWSQGDTVNSGILLNLVTSGILLTSLGGRPL